MLLGSRRYFGVVLASLSLAACHVDGTTRADAATPSADAKGPVGECAAGDRGAGLELVKSSRAARVADPSSLESQRTSLTGACEAGCATTCLELARLSFDEPRVHELHRAACKLGDALGCSLAGELDLAAASSLCREGEMHACAVALRLSVGGDNHAELEQAVVVASAAACETDDARACSIHAWTRCAGLGECSEAATKAAQTAVTLLPEPELLESLAIVQCHAGAPELADQTLASACSAGIDDACARRCETIGDSPILVREVERAHYDRIATLSLLQLDATPSWVVAISAMDADELRGFEAILEAFTPPISEPAAKVPVPAGLREQFPGLVEAIIRSPQLDEKKIRYWFKRLPDMTQEQRVNLLDSLRRQWWIIPGEPGRTPQAHVDRVRLHSGGFGP